MTGYIIRQATGQVEIGAIPNPACCRRASSAPHGEQIGVSRRSARVAAGGSLVGWSHRGQVQVLPSRPRVSAVSKVITAGAYRRGGVSRTGDDL